MNRVEYSPCHAASYKRRNWKQRLTWIALALVVLWGLLWMGASFVVPSMVQKLLPRVAQRVNQMGVELTEVQYDSIRVSPLLNAVTVSQLQTSFDLNPDDDKDLNSQIEIESLRVSVRNPFTMRGTLHARGIEVGFDESDLPPSIPFDRFTNGEVKLPNFPVTNPQQAIRESMDGLKELFLENEVAGSFYFAGDVKVEVKDVVKNARMYTEHDGNHSRLRFKREDIEELADMMNLNLAPEQIDIVSLYPLRVPVLILLTDQAREASRKNEPGDIWRQDAYRHVTWSFLLTRAFGPEFAEQVTDAHEKQEGNTDDERAMDFHNNAIGRILAEQGVTEPQIAERIRDHANIIRHPDEVSKRDPAHLLR